MPKLQCSVSKTYWSVTTNHKKELVEQFGSEDELNANYVCRDARRMRKAGLTDAEILTAVEAGEIVSKTTAPKRLGKTSATKTKSVTATSKASASAPKKSTEPEDPDVAMFLAEAEVIPDGDASDKAV